jgi:hypothetical protein
MLTTCWIEGSSVVAAIVMTALTYASFPPDNEDDHFMQIYTADNGYNVPNGLKYPPITPP